MEARAWGDLGAETAAALQRGYGGAVCAEEVLREMRVREGRDAHHGEILAARERRMLDENFFLYNDVPDTGMWRRGHQSSTCASIRGLSPL